MGQCISSLTEIDGKGQKRSPNSSSTIKIIHHDGNLQEVKQPIKARNIICKNPNYFLCCSESMSIGSRVPHVQEDDDLQLGQIYFLLPLSLSYKPLSLPDLCALAVKASSAIGQDYTVDSSYSNSKLIFR